ncbi:hypothetical protein Glove_38g88 [Diversispora epigaea]|uniref:Uncharacterized protein n=1 Tax=Diversispora epigaea TaxID=1348612 RepID=A0A397JIZ3_9GLOM|nr:hypothetical protein Glove_38g88 [Diversispora epigaea]
MGEQNLEKEIHRILQSSSKLHEYNMKSETRRANTEIQKLHTHNLELIDEVMQLQSGNASKDILLAESKMGEQNLEKEIHRILQSSSKLHEYNMKSETRRANTEIQKLHTHNLELIDEVMQLQSGNASKDILLAESKVKNVTKTEKIKSLWNEMKLLKNSSKKGSEIESLKSKIVELALKISELECLKSEDISRSVIGGDDEKNTQNKGQSSISKSNNSETSVKTHISTDNDLSQYLTKNKNMDQDNIANAKASEEQSLIVPTIKIDTITPTHDVDKPNFISESPKVDTEIIPKVSDDETNKDRDKVPCYNGDAFSLQSNNMLDVWIKPDALSIIPENRFGHASSADVTSISIYPSYLVNHCSDMVRDIETYMGNEEKK